MTGNTVLTDCRNCGLTITKNDLETRIEAIRCIEYHIDELKTQIEALTEKKTVLTMVTKGFRLEPTLLARLIIEIENYHLKKQPLKEWKINSKK